MFWLRNKKNKFPVRTLIWRPEFTSTEVGTEGWTEMRRLNFLNFYSLY